MRKLIHPSRRTVIIAAAVLATATASAVAMSGFANASPTAARQAVPGLTQIGDWEAEAVATAAGQNFAASAQTFPIPLPFAPTAHYVTSPTASCPGSAARPVAAPGNLCVYQAGSENVSAVTIFKDAGPGTGADRWGFSAVPMSASSGPGAVWGSWAVTAP
ncbi:MAG TPA: hypothetical protein VFB06_26325 [Streptosporangiaceae bacterium]|nr:hypothetical protein [Streptosporangiaceae bacterium]